MLSSGSHSSSIDGLAWIFGLVELESATVRSFPPTSSLLATALPTLARLLSSSPRHQHQLLSCIREHPGVARYLSPAVLPNEDFENMFEIVCEIEVDHLPFLELVQRFDIEKWLDTLSHGSSLDSRRKLFDCATRGLRNVMAQGKRGGCSSRQRVELCKFFEAFIERLCHAYFKELYPALLVFVLSSSRVAEMPPTLWIVLSKYPLDQLDWDDLISTVRTLAQYFWEMRISADPGGSLPPSKTLYMAFAHYLKPYLSFANAIFAALFHQVYNMSATHERGILR